MPKNVKNERLTHYDQIRSERYAEAKRNDPETVAAFDAYALARRPK